MAGSTSLGDLLDDFWDSDAFLHVLLKVIWYKGRDKIWRWEKPMIFDKYYSQMKKLKDEGLRLETKLDEFEHKDIAFAVMEYLEGEEIVTSRSRESEHQPFSGERKHGE